MAEDAVAYDKAELRAVIRAFKVMDEDSIAAAKTQSSALADYLQKKIQSKAREIRSNKVATRIADGSTVSKSSKIGEISYKQFPVWSGREGRGSRGWFIYPTLRAEQPYLVREWENGFDQILKEWDR